MKPKFSFHEKVRVRTRDVKGKEVNGEIGAIAGMVETESGDWYYSVFIYKLEECWCFYESELEATGEFEDGEEFRPVGSIRVKVDEFGRGELSDEDETMH